MTVVFLPSFCRMWAAKGGELYHTIICLSNLSETLGHKGCRMWHTR